jgi:hypothetical protein
MIIMHTTSGNSDFENLKAKTRLAYLPNVEGIKVGKWLVVRLGKHSNDGKAEPRDTLVESSLGLTTLR